MPPEVPTQEKLRLRLMAWARYIYRKKGYESVAEMARKIEHNQSSLNNHINGKGDPGLLFAVRLGINGSESMDRILLEDPPPLYFRPGVPPHDAPLEGRSPRHASTEPGGPRKRKGEGSQ